MGVTSGNPTWQDAPSTATLITAARLNAIEDALDAIGGGGASVTVSGTQPTGPALWLLVPAAPDTTPPTAGTLTVTGTTTTTADLAVTGATDEVALHAEPYAYSSDNGSSWSAWQAAATYTATGLTEATAYTFRHKVRDTSGNETIGTAVGGTTDGPVILAADTFDRADSAFGGLGTTSTGAKVWGDPANAYRVLTNQCDPNDTSPSHNIASVDVGVQNFSVSVKLYGSGVIVSGVLARKDTTDTFYHARYSNAAGGVQLYRFLSGAAVQLGATSALSWVSGATLKLVVSEEATGTRARVLVDGVEKINELDTNATRPTGTRAGLRSDGGGAAKFDDFSVTA